ncbi:MAG: DUF5110 domain-containing protein [Chloroflexi bacterium]|mgnify:CR=1 FL=1|nr:DUF5110 domain-containing protein [Chloroflexota bacterium]OJV90635.1 MAG: ABC transporter substrate-binding protein [Chloroflexi bacterium 54-19]
MWEQVANGVWRVQIGQHDSFNPLSLIKTAPRLAALEKMSSPDLPVEWEQVKLSQSSHYLTFSLPLMSEENIYGLGLQFLRLNHRNHTRYLRVNSDPILDTGETHAPVPFAISSRGYGLLINTARIVTVHCGGSRVRNSTSALEGEERLEFTITDSTMEVFLFAGLAINEVVQRYNLFCGGGALPPRWGLGFWHRTQSEYTAQEVLAEATSYRQNDMPCDVIGLEPGWHTTAYPVTYEWNSARFPEPPNFIRQLNQAGFQVNLWEHPYVSPQAKIHPLLAPLSGTHTVWGGLAPDYSLAEVQAIVQNQHTTEHLAHGVSGYKIDECDGSELTIGAWMFPAQAQFPSGHDGEQMRQVYGILLQKMNFEMFRQHNRRTYGLVRASNAGASSLPFVLYSDLYDHRQFVRALCNASLCGLLWTPEVRGAKTGEELVRRVQTVCFSPLAMLNAWFDKIHLWSFPEVTPIIRKYLKLRMRLIPYFYSLFARYHFEGIPPWKAMVLVDQNLKRETPANQTRELTDLETVYGGPGELELDDQFMIGETLLVAPVFAGQKSRPVTLPAGEWYDFETHELYQGGQTIKIETGLERIPVFVRKGSIIPLMPDYDYVPDSSNLQTIPLEIRHYGNVAGEFELFDDDGKTYDYERGEYRWRTLKVETGLQGERQGYFTETGPDWKSAYSVSSWNFIP